MCAHRLERELMIYDLKPYPEMKGTSIPWLGELPAGWSLCRNGSLFVQRNETGFADLPILEVSLKTGVRVREFGGSSRKQIMEDRSKYKRASCGDVAYNMMRMWQGAVGVAPVDGLVSPAYVVARPLPGVLPHYFAYLFRTDAYMGEVDNYSRGIVKDRNRLYWEQFKQIQTPCPPTAEQAAIVRFLNHADRNIHCYIRAKQKLIKLLEEQKQAIIHRAVTRGLDPNVRLKPSGVEWLGDVPEHWLVLRAKYLFREVDSRSEAGTETHLAMSQKLGLVPSSMVQSTLRSESYAGGKLCTIGDLVLNRLKAHLGVFAVAKQSGVISPDYTTLRKQNGAHAEYFECILRSPACRGELRIRAKGIVEGFWRLYTDDFYKICLPVPPLREQQQIMESIAHQTREQAGAISRLECEISLLREYRTRLIADVVTGKLDVRGAAAQLPDEDQDLPAIDELEDISESEEDAPDDLEEAPEDPEP